MRCGLQVHLAADVGGEDCGGLPAVRALDLLGEERVMGVAGSGFRTARKPAVHAGRR